MQNIVCPLNLIMLLHYHTKHTPYAYDEPDHAGSEAVLEGKDMLIDEGLIEPCGTEAWGDDLYRTTEKGAVFIDHLMSIPFPVKKWVMGI